MITDSSSHQVSISKTKWTCPISLRLPQLQSCPDQSGLWPRLWGIILISAHCEQVHLSCIRSQQNAEVRQQTSKKCFSMVSRVLPCWSSYPDFPQGWTVNCKVKQALSTLLLVLVFTQQQKAKQTMPYADSSPPPICKCSVSIFLKPACET